MNHNQPKILLAVLNARYSHPSLGLRCLLANMGSLQEQTSIAEFLIGDAIEDVVEQILAQSPAILGFSLSIWNVVKSRQIMAVIRQVAPEIRIIVGGPEVRWAKEPVKEAHHLLRGEGEEAFPTLCHQILQGQDVPAVVDGGLPNLKTAVLPYDLYSDKDLEQRITYVETSRGCPFGCEFCLSSRERKVRTYPRQALEEAFDNLIRRGCRTFKFIDRTFNIHEDSSIAWLDFFYERWPKDDKGHLIGPDVIRQPGRSAQRNESLFLHFEVVPERFGPRFLKSLSRFPSGGIQLEMGVQSLAPEVGERIGRPVHQKEIAESIQSLKSQTTVHIHADLIIGLPGEDEQSFARGFDKLREMGPDEIQLGILKRLPGAPIDRHTEKFAMKYNQEPPYDVLATSCIDFVQMQRLKRIARYHEIFCNSGRFVQGMEHIMAEGDSAFLALKKFSQWLWEKMGRAHAIGQPRQFALVLEYLQDHLNMDAEHAATVLAEDFLRNGHPRYLPECLRPYLSKDDLEKLLQKKTV
ncbi:MAG: B12-binding domain-containing radical SAM protein [Spirochaetales bacterium]|nr:B12-binding domain-containing radical SAM protein [Spirochaetales bacterium]